jgi:regulator of replication initiation timing
MRARRREINIFNMSLLDILCGALGAFCFMMLVALPYYKPGAGTNTQSRENQQKNDELMREIEKLKDQLGNPNAAEDLAELLRKLQAQIQSLQGQVNQLTSENQKLTADNKDLDRRLRFKKPFLVVLSAGEMNQDLDLYVRDDLKTEKYENPPFDPTIAHHSVYWPGDLNAYVPGHGLSVWVTTDSPANIHYKIYAKLSSEPPARKATGVSGALIADTYNFALPVTQLTPERFWTLVGTLTADNDAKLAFKEATEAERDAEWKAIAKTAPPPLTSASPAANSQQEQGPAASTIDQRRDFMQKRQGRQLLPGPPPSTKP